jgi:hypothetical protein
MVRRTIRGIGSAIRRHPRAFTGVAVAVLLLQAAVPPLVLSIVRKPVDFYTVNPWLSRLPEYLASAVPLREKLAFLSRMAVFWCSADSGFGAAEWGFAVDATDIGRFLLTALLMGTYAALWLRRRAQAAAGAGWGLRLGRHGGVAGALTGVLGLSTGPCSVVGCGAPVLPVVGLAFAGLSSTTLAVLARVSTAATALVLVGLGAGVLYLGWLTGGEGGERRPAGRPTPAGSS